MEGISRVSGWEEKIDILLKNFWPVVIALLLGGLNIFGEPIAAVAYIVAVALYRRGTWGCYAATLAGMYISFSLETAILYAVIISGIAFTMSIRDVIWMKRQAVIISLISSFWYAIVITFALIALDYGTSYTDIAAKCMLVFSLSMVFAKAIEVVSEDIVSVVNKPDAAISILVSMCAILWAAPVEIKGIVVAGSVAVFSMLYIGYRFGMGLGLTWCVMCGVILSVRLEVEAYVVSYTIIMIISLGLYNLLHISRITFGVFYVLAYIGISMAGYNFLLDTENVKALISAIAVFTLLPVRYVAPVDDRVKYNQLGAESPEWGQMVMNRVRGFSDALKRVDYTMADATVGISFGEVGKIIDSFTASIEQRCPIRKTIEAKIMLELKALAVDVRNLMLIKNKQDKYEVYITMRSRGIRPINSGKIKDILETNMRARLVAGEENRMLVGREYMTYVFREKPGFECKTAARIISKYDGIVSGDNYYIGDIQDGQKLIMISDGMGSGEAASASSQNLIDSMEELLQAGVDNDLAIRLVNSYLSEKNRGEMFATMDMFILDGYTGQGRIFKQGAATTYIKRNDWLEEIKSTSLPMGVEKSACCEQVVKKFYDKDIVVMLSDGVFEDLIYQNDDDYMRNLLLGMEYDTPDEIADYIVEGIRKNAYKNLPDDATVVVCKVVKSM